MNPDLVKIIISSLDVKRILARSLLPATVAGAGGAPPAVVIQDGRVAIHVWLLSYKKECQNSCMCVISFILTYLTETCMHMNKFFFPADI